MARVRRPKNEIALWTNDAPGLKEVASVTSQQWEKLGISVTVKDEEWTRYLGYLGPPASERIDAYLLGWIADYPESFNFLELLTCGSGNNNSGYCDPRYDALLERARATSAAKARHRIYGRLEAMVTGPDGAMPLAPIWWYTYANLESPRVKKTFVTNPLGRIDFSRVVPEKT